MVRVWVTSMPLEDAPPIHVLYRTPVECCVLRGGSFLRVSVWRCGGHAPFLDASGTKWHVGFLMSRFLNARS